MDKLSPKLNRSLTNRIALRKHPAADPVSRFENSDGESCAPEFDSSG